MKIVLVGNGKMGQMIRSLCGEKPDADVVAMVGPGDTESVEAAPRADVMMDFSYPGNLRPMLEKAVREKTPLVIGTTGLGEEGDALIREAAGKIPIVYASNYSTGVTVLARLTRLASQALGEDFDIEIVEPHHRMKEDAPSGTAKTLAQCANTGRGVPYVYGREGRPGKRGNEIGVHALRGGTVAGEHRVIFYGNMEEIELRHRADSREIFARGALRAAQFAVGAKPGLYSMEDVLFPEG